MSKPLMVHVITNFAGVGGAEMMLVRLIQQTEHDYQHVIIALMKTSNVYQSTLDRCQSYYALGWNGINTLGTIQKLRVLLKQIGVAFGRVITPCKTNHGWFMQLGIRLKFIKKHAIGNHLAIAIFKAEGLMLLHRRMRTINNSTRLL